MPASLTREDVVEIAALANLELDADEIDLFAKQLADILAYAEQVQQIDTAGVPPTGSVVMRHAADRTDEVCASLDLEAALANAPDAAEDGGFFRVPRVL